MTSNVEEEVEEGEDGFEVSSKPQVDDDADEGGGDLDVTLGAGVSYVKNMTLLKAR